MIQSTVIQTNRVPFFEKKRTWTISRKIPIYTNFEIPLKFEVLLQFDSNLFFVNSKKASLGLGYCTTK